MTRHDVSSPVCPWSGRVDCGSCRFARLQRLPSTPETAVLPGRLTSDLSPDRDCTVCMIETGQMATQSNCRFSLYTYNRQAFLLLSEQKGYRLEVNTLNWRKVCRQQRWSLPLKIASLLRNKVHARWLRVETPARVRTGMSVTVCNLMPCLMFDCTIFACTTCLTALDMKVVSGCLSLTLVLQRLPRHFPFSVC